MGILGLRVRNEIANRYAAALICALLVGVAGGYVAYTAYVESNTITETRTVASWESSGDFTHQATITNGTTAFTEGTVLHNRDAYFRDASPRLNGSFRYVYEASEASNIVTNITVMLRTRSVSTDTERNTTVYWQTNKTLNQTNVASVTPNERVTISFSTNTTAALAEAKRIDAGLGGTPGPLQVAIIARVDISGMRNGQQVNTVKTYRLPIIPSEGVYRVEDPGVVTASGSQTEQVMVQTEPSLVQRTVGLSLLVGSVCTILGLLYYRYANKLSLTQAEREWMRYQASRQEFSDWITTGQVTESTPVDVISTESLEGLVDIAIDTNRRVIEDTSTGKYIVADGDLMYQYTRPENPRPESNIEPEQDERQRQVSGDLESISAESLPANGSDTQTEE